MKTSIKTEFTHCYFNCDTFKQKETTILLNSISGSRLNNDMKLSGYGMISFDEENISSFLLCVKYILHFVF